MLEKQMLMSKEFADNNFGLKNGAGYPELAREVLRSTEVCGNMFSNWMMSVVGATGVADKLRTKGGVKGIVAHCPEIYDLPLSFLYWGIQIGLELQRSQEAVLQELSAKEAE